MIREIIRLKQKGLSNSAICNATGKSRPTIVKYLKAIGNCGLSHEELLNRTDSELHHLFLDEDAPDAKEMNKILIEINNFFDYAIAELGKTGVTRKLLWQEYKEKHPDGLQYSQFCYHLSKRLKSTEGYMPVAHKMGDKAFVDFTGKKFKTVDPVTGEIKEKEGFVVTLSGSQYTYVEACESQKIPDFLRAIENAFHYFGGVPECVVIDNLKSGVKKACKYEPEINEQLVQLALHYNTVIMPTRPRKPKDKSLAEGAVKIAYQRIFARLRNETYYNTQQLNLGIKQCLIKYNQACFQKAPFSREDLFLNHEKKVLKPLPAKRFELKEYKEATVQKNCHISLTQDKCYYSVPYQYVGKKVKVAFTPDDVEIYYQHQRIAFHKRSRSPYKYVTEKEHMRSSHLHVRQIDPDQLLRRAAVIGPDVPQYLKGVMNANSYIEQGYKSCQGILGFVGKVGRERLNNACKRAIEYGVYNYPTIKNILNRGLDKDISEQDSSLQIPFHENIRGKNYYH